MNRSSLLAKILLAIASTVVSLLICTPIAIAIVNWHRARLRDEISRIAEAFAARNQEEDFWAEDEDNDTLGDVLRGGGLRKARDPRMVYLPARHAVIYLGGCGPYQTNNFGCRDDRDYSPQKAPSTFRIALFGDSFGMGLGQPDVRSTLTRMLEDALNAVPHRSYRYEVLNFAVAGYNTLAELGMIEMRIPQFHPDMIIIQFYSDDIEPMPTQQIDSTFLLRGIDVLLHTDHHNRITESTIGFNWFKNCLKDICRLIDRRSMLLLLQYDDSQILKPRCETTAFKAGVIATKIGIDVIDPYVYFRQALRYYHTNNPGIFCASTGCQQGAVYDLHRNGLSNSISILAILHQIRRHLPAGDGERVFSFYFREGYREFILHGN